MITAIVIFVCAALYSFYEYIKSKLSRDLAMATILFIGAIATLIQTLNDNEQSGNIENLSTLNNSLSLHIDTLAAIDTGLTRKTNLLVDNVITLTNQNISLTDSIKKLNEVVYTIVEDVNGLSKSNLNLSKKMDSAAREEIGKNTLTGELNINIDKRINDNTPIMIQIGGLTAEFIKNKELPFWFDTYEPLSLDIQNNQLILSTKIYDFNKNLLVEIDKNKWKVMSQFRNNINFDEKGFEVLDAKNNVVFSIDVVAYNKIKIQGLFYMSNSLMIAGNNGSTTIPFDELNNESYNEAVSKFKKIFIYTGSHYLHKRAN